MSPVRTCIGCRQPADKAELERFVVADGAIATGARGKPGRGAYLHPSVECVDLATTRRAWTRALGVAPTSEFVAGLMASWKPTD